MTTQSTPEKLDTKQDKIMLDNTAILVGYTFAIVVIMILAFVVFR